MTTIFHSILSSEDIQYIQHLPEVLNAKKLASCSFSIIPTNSICDALATLGLDLSINNRLPMKWLTEDTVAHTDTGSKTFTKTFLVYLNDSIGEFIIGSESYPITANTAFVFNEGISHKTVGTSPRLVIGPMSERAEAVGIIFTPQSLNYFPTQTDAQNITNLIYQQSAFYIDNINNYVAWVVDPTNTISIGYNSTPYTLGEDLPVDAYTPGDGFAQYYLYPAFLVYYANQYDLHYDINQLSNSTTSYTLGSVGGFSNWRIHSSSSGSSSQSTVYTAGNTLATGGTYFLYGAPTLVYYANEANALSESSPIGNSPSSYTLSTIGGFSSWRIASNSTGSSSRNTVYNTGDILNSDGVYMLYPRIVTNVTCFLEGTEILCQINGMETYVPVEKIRPGTLVKTSHHGFKTVELIGKRSIANPGTDERIEARLYQCSPSRYPELRRDLYITGCHSILVDTFNDTYAEKTRKSLGHIYITDGRYRLMAAIDERTKPWNQEGTYIIWHLALEHEDKRMNYGIYAEGLLVETCSLHYLKHLSHMELVV